ncbi:MAG: two component transcriptional regulator, LytTR family [Bacteroidetes bacterium]|nr:two component transcriptional regulator, LytTR family [Bacteroidota bacterium]
MNCLIIDDNPIARKVLSHFIDDLDFLTVAGACESIMEATNILNSKKIDLLLLDIELPRMSGLDMLRTIPDLPLVILITSNAEYAVAAFEYNVVDFLLKPIKEDRFLKAIYRAKDIFENNTKELEAGKEYFFIKEKGASAKVMMDDILYIQALGDYVNIHTASRKYTIHYSISAIEKKLPASLFMRVHRSYIIAIDKIDSVEEGTAFIYQTPVPVGDSQRAALMKRINML